MYYLQSRYYNPTWGRFINADALVSTGQGILGNNMFAYCLNNPTNRTDITGTVSLWYYLIIDSDMGFIHRAVQSHIRSNYHVSTEVRLSNYGRADILDSGCVWEIKHAGVSPDIRIAVAYAQALSYQILNSEVTHLGNGGAFSGQFYIGCLDSSYLVEYKTPSAGVVLYTVKEVSDYHGAYDFVYYPVKTEKKTLANNGILGGGGVCLVGMIAGCTMPIERDFSYCSLLID